MTLELNKLVTRLNFSTEPAVVIGKPDLLDGYKNYNIIVLKPNLQGTKNILTSSMISQADTKYVIKYRFTLNEDIVMPDNSILEIDGGSIISDGHFDNETLISYRIQGVRTPKQDSIYINRNGINCFLNVELTGYWKYADVVDLSVDVTEDYNVSEGNELIQEYKYVSIKDANGEELVKYPTIVLRQQQITTYTIRYYDSDGVEIDSKKQSNITKNQLVTIDNGSGISNFSHWVKKGTTTKVSGTIVVNENLELQAVLSTLSTFYIYSSDTKAPEEVTYADLLSLTPDSEGFVMQGADILFYRQGPVSLLLDYEVQQLWEYYYIPSTINISVKKYDLSDQLVPLDDDDDTNTYARYDTFKQLFIIKGWDLNNLKIQINNG